MARNYFKSGEWNVYCMVCNRKIKASLALKRWDGLIVCPDDYENRHPQDFLRARQERISVPFTSDTSFNLFDGPTYPVYPFCTQEGSSGVAAFAVAGCMRPNLGFPNGLPVTQPEIPDEPIPIIWEFNFLTGQQIYLVDGDFLILEQAGTFVPIPTPSISNALLNMTGGQVLLMSNGALVQV